MSHLNGVKHVTLCSPDFSPYKKRLREGDQKGILRCAATPNADILPAFNTLPTPNDGLTPGQGGQGQSNGIGIRVPESESKMNDAAQTKVILLVEDNPDDEALTLRALAKNNIMNEVFVAHDGVEALDYLFGAGTHQERDTSIQPQLVLLDLKLPRIDGLEVLQKMRADPRTRLLPVVILTSSKEDQDVIRSYSSGANSYIQKPVDFTQFTEAVRQLGLYWLVLNETPPTTVTQYTTSGRSQ